ncbi:MAG: hypothetical protein ACJ75J_00515 [Cytophagaceae bacterium]
MNRSRFHRTFKIFRRHLGANILRKDIKAKEEVLLTKLEDKLGKSKEEVKQLLSEDLIKLLTQVPFSH